jgi:hypothetical protein
LTDAADQPGTAGGPLKVATRRSCDGRAKSDVAYRDTSILVSKFEALSGLLSLDVDADSLQQAEFRPFLPRVLDKETTQLFQAHNAEESSLQVAEISRYSADEEITSIHAD